jgi:hypothetical protein
MEEAAVAYRQWLLLVPALWLRSETAAAAERVNGGWNRPRNGLRVLAAGAATVVLALVIADAAHSPTNQPAAAEPEAAPVTHVSAVTTKPVARHARPAKKQPRPRARKRTRVIEPAEAPRVVSVESQPVVTAQVVEPPKAQPRREPKRVKTVVVADPPPVQPEPADVISTTPVPEPTPDGTTPTPPTCPGTAAGVACPPPPRPPVLTCGTCGLVTPVPPPRRPLRIVAPATTP